MNDPDSSTDYIHMTADIVSAYVSNNSVRASELPAIIEAVHTSLYKAGDPKVEEPVAKTPTPAVPIKKSITDNFIICLEDGKKFKSLKRHLSTAYDMSPDDSRAKWGLGRDYPMVAPAYASARSSLARQMGLGRKRDDDAVQTVPSGSDEPEQASHRPAPRKRKEPRPSSTPA